jgi:hypothetical protein
MVNAPNTQPATNGHEGAKNGHTNGVKGTGSHQEQVSPILLSLFQCRFMSVAEAMGRSLQQTSVSTNIKERLDYSCALFGPDGDLVANAPFMFVDPR